MLAALIVSKHGWAPTTTVANILPRNRMSTPMLRLNEDSSYSTTVDAFMKITERQQHAADKDGWQWLAVKSLPTFEELQEACHMVAEGLDSNLFLCAKPMDPLEGFECTKDKDYSEYYGQPVYLCPGGWALPAM